MEELMEYLPALLPLLIIDIILAITALLHVLKHPHYRFGSKIMWIFIVCFVQLFGPIIYFAFGRGDAS